MLDRIPMAAGADAPRFSGELHKRLEMFTMIIGMQPKLLRVLEEKVFERVGGNKALAARLLGGDDLSLFGPLGRQ